ncbi:MAG: hypothetical protein Fur0022_37840 [Anaerolineales bacterium]
MFRSRSLKLLVAVMMLVLASLACGSEAPAEPTAVPPTAVPPTAEPTAVPPTAVPPTAVPPTDAPAQPSPAPVEPVSGDIQTYFDDFSSDVGNWEVFASDAGSAIVANGILDIGPFSNCGTGAGESFGCFSQCLWCGTLIEYNLTVDAAYLAGDPNQTYGMVLRFQDQNGNGLVDAEDYYLDFEISSANQYFAVYEHLPGRGWATLDERQDPTILADINTLNAYAYDLGHTIDVSINGVLVENISVPTEYAYGTVGLVVGFAGMRAGFDNFIIDLPPGDRDITGIYDLIGTNPDGSTYTGVVTIAPGNNGYDILWEFASGQQVGTGRLSRWLFSARYATVGNDVVGSITCLLKDNGSLECVWRNDFEEGMGTEVLIPR